MQLINVKEREERSRLLMEVGISVVLYHASWFGYNYNTAFEFGYYYNMYSNSINGNMDNKDTIIG